MTPFTQIPNEAFEKARQVGAVPWLVYCWLRYHADRSGLCWPSIETLQERCGIRRSTVFDAIGKLRSAGLLSILEPGTRKKSARYLVPGPGQGTRQVQVAGLVQPAGLVRPEAPNESSQPDQSAATSPPSGTKNKNQEKNKTQGTKHKARAAAAEVSIPPALDTPAFRAAWEEWGKHRREIRKTLTPSTRARQLKKLAAYGAALAVASIEVSIERGWTGLFEPKGAPNGNGKPRAEPGRVRERDWAELLRKKAAAAAAAGRTGEAPPPQTAAKLVGG